MPRTTLKCEHIGIKEEKYVPAKSIVGIVVTHIDFRIVGKINKIEKLSFQIFLLIQIFKKSKKKVSNFWKLKLTIFAAIFEKS